MALAVTLLGGYVASLGSLTPLSVNKEVVGIIGREVLSALGYANMLRSARIEDAETIAAIHVHTWQIAYEGIVPTQFLASLSIQERANMWRKVISERQGSLLLAVAPHGEVGFISFGPSRDQDGERKAEIYAFYVFAAILASRRRSGTFGGSKAEARWSALHRIYSLGSREECTSEAIL